MKNLIKLTTLFLISILITACASSPFIGERVSTLNPGDDISKVTSVMGKPDGFENTKDNETVYKYLNRHISGWDNKTTDYYLHFKNGKLSAIKNGAITDNSASINKAIDSINAQIEAQKQRDHETRLNLNSNKAQKIIICQKGDLMCY